MRRVLLLGCLLVGCSHSDPFTPAKNDPLVGPFRNARPLQLTLNVGLDGWPSWSPDGSRVLYSAQQAPPDLDRCLVALPAVGGTATEVNCPLRVPDGLTEEFDQPVSDGTRLAWVRATTPVDRPAPYSWQLWMRTLTPPGDPVLLQTFPYDVPSGHVHDLPRYLQWLRPGVLLYLGSETGGCCRTDTLQFGELGVLLDVTGSAPVRTYIPGTERASALSGSSDGTEVYYTFFGDSVVYRQVLATGTVDVLHNFGTGHVARDPVVHGNVLVAVIDGVVNVGDIPPFGLSQIDKGGLLRAVDLTSGAETPLEDGMHFFRHPRLSPAGDRMVAEGYPYVVTLTPLPEGGYLADTTVTLINDVWLWEE